MTIGERLQPTIDAATNERDKAVKRAKMTGYSLNVAIAVQVLLGALTTGLGAALSGKSSSIAISILGGASTLAASYLARARGSNEPEFSLLRARALNQFLREIYAFKLDHGHKLGHTFDERIDGFRFGLENILGNPMASVTTTEDMGPRRDGPGGPAVLGLGGGGAAIGIGTGTNTGFGANLNGVPHGNSHGLGAGLAISPQQQQQPVQHQGKAVQGMAGPAFGGNAPPPFTAAQQMQGAGAKASLAHSMV
ncbi:hypothetical protein BGW80DRAFT_1298975 [Lactifluus volemus]|nr:hypothetical protein BGW80DRAFT_1298975 [Lactifluus volemus]